MQLDKRSISLYAPVYACSVKTFWFGLIFTGQSDERYIRVETCMFMIKLPQYSSQEVMTQQLMYAINCREDPLSG